jgi:LAO/AO transport system kinase
MTTDAHSLADRVRRADSRAIARAISLIENEAPTAAGLLAALFPAGGRAVVVGVTGPPGAGKSTLVDRLATAIRRSGRRVGIIAVDPSSPFSGGAVLGDRVRMQAHASDPGVFIRSMATRGHLGGLARATSDAVAILDAAGFDVVLVETVGVGQDEVDIVKTADVSVVVLVPGAGDEVQALKAGIMEIADVFVINKADRDGAERMVAAVEATLALAAADPASRRPPVLRTVAISGEGTAELLEAVDRFPRESPGTDQRRRLRSHTRLREELAAVCVARITEMLSPGEWEGMVSEIDARRMDPRSAASRLVDRLMRSREPHDRSAPA